MNCALRNVKRVWLKSVEMPIGFSTNVRTGSTDTFSFMVSGQQYNVVLPEKTHATITTLLADLTTAATTVVGGVIPTATMTFALTTQTTGNPLRVAITLANFGSNFSTFSVVETNLSRYILGMRPGFDSFVSPVYTGGGSYNLNPDLKIYLSISNFNALSQSMSKGRITFKIPLTAVNGQVLYWLAGNTYEQWCDIPDNNLIINQVQCQVFDRFNNPIQNNGLDWAMTLMFEMED